MTSELAYVRAAEMVGEVRGAEARAVPARARRRAAAHRLALPLARHLVPGHGRRARRRRHRVPLLHPRARERSSTCSRRWWARGSSTASIRSAARATTCPRAGREKCRDDDGPDRSSASASGRTCSRATRSSWRAPRASGVISRELAQEVGISGPLIRGSGVDYDIRRAEPYSSYEDFDFKVPVETAGDCFARYRVRMVRVPGVDQDRPPGARRAARGPDLVAARREVGGPGAGGQGRGLRPGRGRARRGRLLPRRRRQRQALPHEVARRLVLEPRGAARTSSPATRSPTSSPSWAPSIPCSARSTGDPRRPRRDVRALALRGRAGRGRADDRALSATLTDPSLGRAGRRASGPCSKLPPLASERFFIVAFIV